MTNSTKRFRLMAKQLQHCFCTCWQNRHFHVKFWKCQKSVYILPHETK